MRRLLIVALVGCKTGEQLPCVDAAPANATSEVVDVEVDPDGSAPDCAWICDDGFGQDAGACVHDKDVACVEAEPEHATSVVVDVTITYSDDGWPEPPECAWACDTDYAQVQDLCLDEKSVQCVASAPAHGVDHVEDVTVTYTDAGGWASPAPCEWSCEADYAEEDEACLNVRSEPCTNTAPVHAASIADEVEVAYTDAGGWAEPADCDWVCDVNYTASGPGCAMIDVGPGLCSGDWCWERPLPQGSTISAVWGADPDEMWFATETGQLLLTDGADWSLEYDDPTLYFDGVWGSETDDVWALASDAVGPVLLHYDGAVWTDVDTSFLDSNLQFGSALWGSDADHVWLAAGGYWLGRRRVIAYEFDGAVWTEVLTSSYETLQDIAGTGPNDVWMTGDDQFHWDGTEWVVSGTSVPALSVWPAGPHEVWVGTVGQINLTDGGSSTVSYVLPAGDEVTDMWGVGDDVFAAVQGMSYSGVLAWDGATWVPQDLRTWGTTAIWGLGADDVWVGGNYGAAWHYDGAWSQIAWDAGDIAPRYGGVYPADVFAMWTGSGATWAVGGRAARWTGTTWEDMDVPTTSGLLGVSGTSATDVWAAGTDGVVAHWNGTTWTLSTPTSVDLNDIVAVSATERWIVGEDGYVARDTGAGFVNVPVGTTADLYEVWAAPDGTIWIGGDSGLYAWSGIEFLPVNVGGALSRVCGLGGAGTDVWVLDVDGRVYHSAAGTWSLDEDFFTSSTLYFHNLYVGQAGGVWVTSSGNVHERLGAAWAAHPAPARVNAFAERGSDLIAGGDGAMILRYAP